MSAVEPDKRVRVALDETDGVAFAGGPSSVSMTRASDGETVEWTGGALPLKSVPDLIDCEWELSGVTVRAQLDVVSRRYCSLDAIRAYRPDEYMLADAPDAEVEEARARAEETVEGAARRVFQPVLRRAWVDRPNCRTRTCPIADGERVSDIRRAVSATLPDGSPVPVRVLSGVELGVGSLPIGSMAEVVVECGMERTPEEVSNAVKALACWYLLPKAGPENSTSTSTEAGVLNFVIGGVAGAATSLPEVNAVIERCGMRGLVVG